MRERDVVDAFVGDKWRPAVVVAVGRERLTVACGSSQRYPSEAGVTVELNSRAAASMGLALTTYFYRRNFKLLIPVLVRPRGDGRRRCPPEILGALLDLMASPARRP